MASNTRATHLVDWARYSDPRGRLRSDGTNLALIISENGIA